MKKTFYYIQNQSIFPIDVIQPEPEEVRDGAGILVERIIREVNLDYPPLTEERGVAVGETLQDAQQGKYVLLDAIQAQFYLDNPTASAEEVWNAALTPPPPPPPPPTLEELKAELIGKIMAHDSSPAVNEFYVNEMPLWFSKEERIALKNRLDTEEAFNKITTKLWLPGMMVEIPIANLRGLLAKVELYAIEAYDVTQMHVYNAGKITEVKDVPKYDFTTGYPQKESFTL